MRDNGKPETRDTLLRSWELAYEDHVEQHGSTESSPYLWNETPIPFLEERDVIRQMRKDRCHTVLDAGCGDGRNALYLERLGFFVVGVDTSGVALDLAVRRAQREHQQRVVFIEQDITQMSLRGPFDMVVCADVMGQIAKPELALGEFRRVLRPRGGLLANFYTKGDATYGCGKRIDEWTFEYRGTLFCYYDESRIRSLMDEWENIEIRESTWFDPPHGEFRPCPHQHTSIVVSARKPEV